MDASIKPKRKPSVIAFVSGKGGAGKSVIIANLSARLAKQKKNVLMVDCDFFTRGLTFYMIGDKSATAGLLDFLKGDADTTMVKEVLERHVKDYSSLSLLPASSATTMYSVSDLDRKVNVSGQERLAKMYCDFRKLLDSLKTNDFDYIFLDTRSGVDPVSLLPALAADEFILVVEEDKTSWRIGELLISEMKKLSGSLTERTDSASMDFRGFILNKVTEQIPTSFVHDYLEKRVIGGKCLLQIPLERAVPMAFKDDKLVIEDAPSSVFSRKMRILEDIVTERIEQERREKGFVAKFLEFYGSNELVLFALSFFMLIMGLLISGGIESITFQTLYLVITVPILIFLFIGILYRFYRVMKRQ